MVGDLGDLGVRRLEPGRTQQLTRLGHVQAQLVGPELDDEAPSAQRSERQWGMTSRGEHELRARGHVSRQRGDGIQAHWGLEQVQVIDDEDDGVLHRRQRDS